MIERNDDLYELSCDICGYVEDQFFDTFEEAVSFKKDKSNEWRSKKIDGEWHDMCPDCAG